MRRLPPPVYFLVTFALGFMLQWSIWPTARATLLPPAVAAVGSMLTAGGILLAVGATQLFRRYRTTIVPHHVSTALVVDGPYRFTRNPMYASLVLMYVGTAIWTRTWLALPLVSLPLVVVIATFIPLEESQLRTRFGTEYDAYARRVRRWL